MGVAIWASPAVAVQPSRTWPSASVNGAVCSMISGVPGASAQAKPLRKAPNCSSLEMVELSLARCRLPTCTAGGRRHKPGWGRGWDQQARAVCRAVCRVLPHAGVWPCSSICIQALSPPLQAGAAAASSPGTHLRRERRVLRKHQGDRAAVGQVCDVSADPAVLAPKAFSTLNY